MASSFLDIQLTVISGLESSQGLFLILWLEGTPESRLQESKLSSAHNSNSSSQGFLCRFFTFFFFLKEGLGNHPFLAEITSATKTRSVQDLTSLQGWVFTSPSLTILNMGDWGITFLNHKIGGTIT